MEEKKGRGSGLIPLQPGTQRTREIQKKALQARVENAKIRKTIRAELQMMLEEEIENDEGQVMTLRQGITAALLKAALGGNTKAFELIRDTIGEKPTDKLDVSSSNFDVMAQVTKRMNKYRSEQQN